MKVEIQSLYKMFIIRGRTQLLTVIFIPIQRFLSNKNKIKC